MCYTCPPSSALSGECLTVATAQLSDLDPAVKHVMAWVCECVHKITRILC
jgi:hypothetical protein